MFVGFKLDEVSDFVLDFETYGDDIFKENKNDVKDVLDKYFNKDGSLDGSALQSSWFPQIECDIFLSHSHKDEKQAKALAGWLNKEFGLKVFIDSCVWSYSLDLQKIIDNSYCRPDPEEQPTIYSYEKVIYSTSHIHMMLSTALSMMIDKCECIFLLSTPNVITTHDAIEETKSPWIYHELAMMNLVKKQKWDHYRAVLLKEAGVQLNEQKDLDLRYNVDTSSLIPLYESDLTDWLNNYNPDKTIRIGNTSFKQEPLDYIYLKKEIIQEVPSTNGV